MMLPDPHLDEQLGQLPPKTPPSAETQVEKEGGQTNNNLPTKKAFAAFSPEKRRFLAGQGGRSAQKRGKAHRYSSQEARQAVRRGANATAAKKGPANLSSIQAKARSRCGSFYSA